MRRQAGPVTMHIELYRGIAGLQQLQSDWASLLTQAARPRFYHAYGWWLAYLGHLESNPDSMYFFLFRDAHGAVAILPMQLRFGWRYGMPCRELGSPEHPHLPMHDMLYRPNADVDAMFTQLRESLRSEHSLGWDMMRFTMLPSESPLNRLSQEPAATVRSDPPCSYIPCDTSYEQLFESFSKNFRNNLKKARSRLEKTAGANYLVVTDLDELRRYFDDFLRIEASGWKGSTGSGTAIALDPQLMNFYRDLINQFSPQRHVCLNFLRVGDQVIAACFCLLDRDTLYVYKIAYDEAWARLSPGQLLLERVIRDGTDFGRYRCVNLISDAAWHRGWQPRQFALSTICIANSTPVGQLVRAGMSLRKAATPLYRRLAAARQQFGMRKKRAEHEHLRSGQKLFSTIDRT